MVNEQLLRFFQGFHHDAHPMAMVSAVVASMAAFYHDTTHINIRGIARSSRIASSRSCRPSPRRPTSTRWGSPSSIRATICATARTCSTCSSRFLASRMRSIRSRPRRWICCSFCTRTTNRTRAPRRCVWPAARARIPTPRFRPACPPCGDRRTAAPTKPCSTCWTASARSRNIDKFLARVKDKNDSVR
jgi:hypothetical protein